MADMEVYSVLIARVQYADGIGSKVRAAVVIKFNDQIIRTYRITSQYENKQEAIKQQYFEIIDWYQAKLKKPSWIDTVQYYDLENEGVRIKIIGKLTDRDIERLIEFLKAKEI